MMFAGTSGVLSHTLAHAPMASAAINAVVVHRVHRVNTTARDTFRATRRRVERATRRARDAIAMDDALDRDARRDRVVDVDVDERAPMLASTPSTAGGARRESERDADARDRGVRDRGDGGRGDDWPRARASGGDGDDDGDDAGDGARLGGERKRARRVL